MIRIVTAVTTLQSDVCIVHILYIYMITVITMELPAIMSYYTIAGSLDDNQTALKLKKIEINFRGHFRHFMTLKTTNYVGL